MIESNPQENPSIEAPELVESAEAQETTRREAILRRLEEIRVTTNYLRALNMQDLQLIGELSIHLSQAAYGRSTAYKDSPNSAATDIAIVKERMQRHDDQLEQLWLEQFALEKELTKLPQD